MITRDKVEEVFTWVRENFPISSLNEAQQKTLQSIISSCLHRGYEIGRDDGLKLAAKRVGNLIQYGSVSRLRPER